MDERQDFVPPRFSTADRLTMADRIAFRLRGSHGDALLAIAIEGSTAKGLDRPESDLELRAIVEGGAPHRWHAFFCDGMFVGVSAVDPATAREEAAEVDYQWPFVSDALFTARVLYDKAAWYPRLRAIAAEAEARADFRELTRDALMDMYEHVYKVFALRDGPGGDAGAAMALAHDAREIAHWAAAAVGLLNRHRYLSSRTVYSESAGLANLPDAYGTHLAGVLSLETDGDQLRHHTGRLWAACRRWAERNEIAMDDDALACL